MPKFAFFINIILGTRDTFINEYKITCLNKFIEEKKKKKKQHLVKYQVKFIGIFHNINTIVIRQNFVTCKREWVQFSYRFFG